MTDTHSWTHGCRRDSEIRHARILHNRLPMLKRRWKWLKSPDKMELLERACRP